MPTLDRQAALSEEAARARAATLSFRCRAEAPAGADGAGACPDRVGLEPEYLVYRTDAAGAPAGRLPLAGPDGVLAILDGLAHVDARVLARDPAERSAVYPLTGGGRLTFEPGAQVEHSTAPFATAAEVAADVERVHCLLATALRARGARIGSAGVDPWYGAAEVPQQLEAPRYPAMAAYFAARGPHGATMMRLSASCQVNLDLGSGGLARERWLVANLASPFTTATFAASPAPGFVSTRAHAWQELDGSRTGFPPGVLAGGHSDPGEDWAEAALAADVMFFRAPDGRVEPGRAGFTFADWIRAGHPAHGFPCEDDLDVHLTTLFFEVRPRGFLELRAADAVPAPWRFVHAVLATALVYDDRARGLALELLERHTGELDRLWRVAARAGLADDRLGAPAEHLWGIALAGARRMPSGFFRERDLGDAEAFLERFVARRTAPAADLEAALHAGAAAALDWAAPDPCAQGSEPASVV